MEKKTIRLRDQSSYPCSSCDSGRLFFNWDTYSEEELLQSKKQRDADDGWGIEEYYGVFSVKLKCNICESITYCIGDNFYEISDVTYDEDGCVDILHEMTLYPKSFIPPIHYIKIPDQCPREVKKTLIESFSIAPSSTSAAANRIRVSIEYLLDSLNIPANKNLHNRIDNAEKTNAQLSSLKDAMKALKWIGNEGSHAGKILSPQNIDVAYNIISHILNELYAQQNTLASIISLINKNNGISGI